MNKNMNKYLTASQVRTIIASPRKYLYESHVATSASNEMGQRVHEQLTKYMEEKDEPDGQVVPGARTD